MRSARALLRATGAGGELLGTQRAEDLAIRDALHRVDAAGHSLASRLATLKALPPADPRSFAAVDDNSRIATLRTELARAAELLRLARLRAVNARLDAHRRPEIAPVAGEQLALIGGEA